MDLQKKITQVIDNQTKFIAVTGGVCSSIGKGVLVSSMGVLLKNAGYSIAVVKWDPYLNVDPGTMSPMEHGEVFVTADGAETDLDLGHYERMMQVHLTRKSSVSSGQIFEEVLQGEREGKYLGRCIQLVPHVVDAIKNRLLDFALEQKADFVLIEIGGTVGDMEGDTFLEAIRQVRLELGQHRLLHLHLSYVPYLSWAHEIKTKPTQHSVYTLKGLGIIPDSLVLRAEQPIDKKPIEKLSVMCGIDKSYIFQSLTYQPIYKLFLDLNNQGLCERIQTYFGIKNPRETDLSAWSNLINYIEASKTDVTIALVAKYVGSNDPYISVIEAIKNAGYWHKINVKLVVLEAEQLERERNNQQAAIWQELQKADGIVVPGGFDCRGIEGKIMAAAWARERKVPYLGLCLGMQVMLIEFARSVLNMADANSTEFNQTTKYPVISLLAEQEGIDRKGATMRLGTYPCKLEKGSKAYAAYGKDLVYERHRHRYEFNNIFRQDFEKAGVLFSGIYPEKGLIEVAELKNHPFMLGTQAHPEFTSAPLNVNPLFKAFMQAVVERIQEKQ